MKLKILFVIINTFLLNALAYDGTKCMKNVFHPLTKRTSVGEAGILSISTVAPTSTSQFVSSTGSCSAMAEMNLRKKEFIANNLKPLIIDSSKGSGEYLLAYSFIAGCDRRGQDQLLVLFQKNLIEIYGKELDKQPKEVYESLETIMKSDLEVFNGCKLNT